MNENALTFKDGSEPQLRVDQAAEKMDSSHGTVFRHIKEIGKVSQLGKWPIAGSE